MNWGPDPSNDPQNVGWLFWSGGNAADEKAWTQLAPEAISEPPEGFFAQPAHPGWYLRPDVDDADLANWWHDETVPPDQETYEPIVERFTAPAIGTFQAQPSGVILHGSRSGSSNTTEQEYNGTKQWAQRTEYVWNATIGDDAVAIHLAPNQWAWNAKEASRRYIGVEFAQATVDRPISDGQVRAFCWYFTNVLRDTWPGLPLVFPTHAELEANGQIGQPDGKTDVFPAGDPRADELRTRILARLGFSEPPADVTGGPSRFPMTPDYLFTPGELYPTIQQYAEKYGIDPRILAGMVAQESSWHNYRVHRDGTGHGLLGYDDNGLLGDFEEWSGLSIGRGASAEIIPVELQLEFAAKQLRSFQDTYADDPELPGASKEFVGPRAWHAGGGYKYTDDRYRDDVSRNGPRGREYEQIIRNRISELGL